MTRLFDGLMAGMLMTMFVTGAATPVFAMAEQTAAVVIDPQSGCWSSEGAGYAFEGDFKGGTVAYIRNTKTVTMGVMKKPMQVTTGAPALLTAIGPGQVALTNRKVGERQGTTPEGGWEVYRIPRAVHYMLVFLEPDMGEDGVAEVCVRQTEVDPHLPE